VRLVFSAWNFIASCLEHVACPYLLKYKYSLYFTSTVLVSANPFGSVVGHQTA